MRWTLMRPRRGLRVQDWNEVDTETVGDSGGHVVLGAH